MAGDKPRPLFSSEPDPPPTEAPARPAALRFDEVSERPAAASPRPAPLSFDARPELTRDDLDDIGNVMHFGTCGRCGSPMKPPLRRCLRCGELAHSADCACLTCRSQRYATQKRKESKPMFASTDVVPSTPVQVGPTLLNLPGMKVRRRFEVSAEDLRAKNSDISSDIFDLAREAILVVNLDDASGAQFLKIGLFNQNKFVEYSSDMLSLSTDPRLDEMNQGLKEIGSLLAAKELSQLFSGHSGWKRWFEGEPSFEEAKVALKGKVQEVQTRSSDLRDRIPQLNLLKAESESIGQKLTELVKELEIDLVVARFLIGRLKETPEKDQFKEWAEVLQRRVDSVMLTRITVRQATLQLQLIQKHLRHLTENVNTALVNLIPAWCGNCVGFLSSIRQSQPCPQDKLGPLLALRDSILNLITTEN